MDLSRNEHVSTVTQPGNARQKSGRFTITHVFQHNAEDVPEDELGDYPVGQSTEVVRVPNWDYIADTIDSMMLHTGHGFTVSLTIVGDIG